jgi:hypothetical protein
MANLLKQIGEGLRGAGAVFSPDVYQSQNQERAQFEQIKEQRAQLILQMGARAVESGAMTPEKFQLLTQKYGGGDMQLAGPSVATQKTQADMQREQSLTQYRSTARQKAFAKPNVVQQPVGEGMTLEGDQGRLDPVNLDQPAPISERQMAYADELIASGEPELVKEGTELKKAITEKDAKQSPLGVLIAERKQVAAQYGENHPLVKQYDARIQKETSGSAAERNVQFVELPTGKMVDGKAEFQNYAVVGRNEDGTPKLVPQGKPAPKGSLVDVNNQLFAPQPGVDAQGNPVFFQPNKGGGAPTIVPGVTPKAPEGYSKQKSGISSVVDSMESYKKALTNIGGRLDRLTPSKRLELGTQYNNLMLQAKEAYNLGVLNGPDYMILQQVIKNPLDPTSLIYSAEDLKKQVDVFNEVMGRVRQSIDRSYGQGSAVGAPEVKGLKTETIPKGTSLENTWEDETYMYRQLPDGSIQRKKK